MSNLNSSNKDTLDIFNPDIFDTNRIPNDNVEYDKFSPIGFDPALLKLTSGSIFAGSPVTFNFRPLNVPVSRNLIFHRVVIEVICGINDKDFQTIKLLSPIYNSLETVSVDVSSAIMAALDGYHYDVNQTTWPYVSWRIKAYEEYMKQDGVIYSGAEKNAVYLPSETEYYRSIAGQISDIERLQSTSPLPAYQHLSTKPTSSPELICLGDTFAYSPDYETPQSLAKSMTLLAPQNVMNAIIGTTGMKNIGGHPVYILPNSERKYRQNFLFINSRGVLESICVPRAYKKNVRVNVNKFVIARQETFNSLSRSSVVKQGNYEEWSFTSDPLTEEWLYWYQHEFLMAEHVWLYLPSSEGPGGSWLPCNIVPDEETTLFDRTKADKYSVSFKVLPDINGKINH